MKAYKWDHKYASNIHKSTLNRHISTDKNILSLYQSQIKPHSHHNFKKCCHTIQKYTLNYKLYVIGKESKSILTEFPGEDAPGTGHRQFPKAHETNVNGISKHLMRSTIECYEAFPLLVHTSCPINISEVKMWTTQKMLKTLPDAGPLTGHRRRPENIERFGSDHTVPSDPLPSSINSISYRKKQVKMRNMHL